MNQKEMNYTRRELVGCGDLSLFIFISAKIGSYLVRYRVEYDLLCGFSVGFWPWEEYVYKNNWTLFIG